MKISTSGLNLSYGATQILKEITLNIENHEFVGILGPNGSGKSTLLKCMYRVLKPDTGAIFLDGESVQSIRVRDSAKKMAVVAQHNTYQFDFTVQEVVLMGRSPYKKTLERDHAADYEIVAQALKTVGMEALKERSFSTLSGGEQQRVILARALAQQTPCLILDEPTNHLDITHQLQLLQIIKNLNLTVVAAIHDLNIAAAYCNRIYVLEQGKIIAAGSPKQVLTTDFLQDHYQVNTEIIEDRKGKMHILFLSA